MSTDRKTTNLQKDWDKRIAGDYRFWMADGTASDAAMWESGKRDSEILLAGLSDGGVALELGCGVGRLLYWSREKFEKVIGVDVSEVALGYAREYFSNDSRVELLHSDGESIPALESDSIDIVYSYAVLGHIPVRNFVSCMHEINRVLTTGGLARIQLYLGPEQETVIEDTFSIRCYEQNRFSIAMEMSGFSIVDCAALELPFEASDPATGRVPYMVTLKKVANTQADARLVEGKLLARREIAATADWPGSELEYQMAITRAQELVFQGAFDAAIKHFEFALERYKAADPGIERVLQELKHRQAATAQPEPKPSKKTPT